MVGVTEKDYNETLFLRMQWQEEEVRPRKQAAYLFVCQAGPEEAPRVL